MVLLPRPPRPPRTCIPTEKQRVDRRNYYTRTRRPTLQNINPGGGYYRRLRGLHSLTPITSPPKKTRLQATRLSNIRPQLRPPPRPTVTHADKKSLTLNRARGAASPRSHTVISGPASRSAVKAFHKNEGRARDPWVSWGKGGSRIGSQRTEVKPRGA